MIFLTGQEEIEGMAHQIKSLTKVLKLLRKLMIPLQYLYSNNYSFTVEQFGRSNSKSVSIIRTISTESTNGRFFTIESEHTQGKSKVHT